LKFSASPDFLFLVRLLVVAALGRSMSLLVEVNVRFALEFLAEACRCWLRLGIFGPSMCASPWDFFGRITSALRMLEPKTIGYSVYIYIYMYMHNAFNALEVHDSTRA
jgi:hypothetical protein